MRNDKMKKKIALAAAFAALAGLAAVAARYCRKTTGAGFG